MLPAARCMRELWAWELLVPWELDVFRRFEEQGPLLGGGQPGATFPCLRALDLLSDAAPSIVLSGIVPNA